VWLAWHGVALGVFTLITAAILDMDTAVMHPSTDIPHGLCHVGEYSAI
jgi:hypothetical protein